jgi:outer membrane protein TolC
MEETDHEQIQVTVNTNLNAMKAIENQLLIANYLLKIQLGLNIEDEVILTEDLDDIMAGMDYEGLLAEEFELGNSIDYELLEIQTDISELNLKREKAAFLPSVSAFYMYQDKTDKAVFDFTINHIIGLSLNVPIFSSGERLAKVKQAKIELQKSENTMMQMTDMLIMEAEQARLQYQNAYEKYEIQKKNIELAQKIYERTSIKFREGMASSMDLNQANNQYLNNFSSYTGSISELLNANLRYKKALNNL